MNLLIIAILGIILVGIFLIPPIRDKFKKDYENVVLTAVVAFLATFFGVWLALHTENVRQNKSEVSFVRNKMTALMFETSSNIANIKTIRSHFSQDKVSINQLSNLVASEIISDPLVVKHTSTSLIISVSAMADSIDTFNNYSSVALNHFIFTRKNTEEILNRIYKSLDIAEFFIRSVQREIYGYVEVHKDDLEDEGFKEKINWLTVKDEKQRKAKLKLLREVGSNNVE